MLSTTNSTTSTTVSTTTVTTSTPSKETTTEKSTETSDVEASFAHTYLIDSANTSTYIHIKDLKPNTPYKFKFEILIYDSKGNTFAHLVGLYLHFIFFQKMFYIMIIWVLLLDNILIGSGEQSESMCETITLPSSPPHNVECVQDSEYELTFKWKEPINVAPDVDVDNYNFKLVEGKFRYELITEPTTTEQSTEPITTEQSTEPITTEPKTTKPTTTEPTTTEPTTTEPTTTEPTTTKPTTIKHSTKPSKQPDYSTSISETFSTKRQKVFSKFRDFIDFLSFSATNKEENALRAIAKEVTIPRNVDGKLTDDC